MYVWRAFVLFCIVLNGVVCLLCDVVVVVFGLLSCVVCVVCVVLLCCVVLWLFELLWFDAFAVF